MKEKEREKKRKKKDNNNNTTGAASTYHFHPVGSRSPLKKELQLNLNKISSKQTKLTFMLA